MKALREIKKIKNNKVVLTIPPGFAKNEVEILILPHESKKKYNFRESNPTVTTNSFKRFNFTLLDPVDDCETRNAANSRKLSRCQIILLRFGLTASQDLFYPSRNHFRLSPTFAKIIHFAEAFTVYVYIFSTGLKLLFGSQRKPECQDYFTLRPRRLQ